MVHGAFDSATHNLATQFRIDSVRATSEAGSRPSTSCLSAAEIMAALFFAEMRFDPKDPQHPEADRFVLSKGHAAPILYAAWSAAGAFPREHLLTLRQFTSDLEGHPMPRQPFTDVATGSLGQGLCAAIGIALNARRIGSDYRTYVLLGDGESAEGSVWEAADVGTNLRLDNLCAITDMNAFGQRPGDPMAASSCRLDRSLGRLRLARDRDRRPRFSGCARRAGEAKEIKGKPTMIIAGR